MQGSVAIPTSPVLMENFVFRQKLGMSFTRSVLQRSSEGNTVSRCLFDAPDPKQAKDFVREVELKNALNFGKRFNFDIIAGEPFPSAKKIKFTNSDDSDEENVEKDDNEGYVWSEKYSQDYMAMCNKHAVNTSIMAPSRTASVSLLFAPIINSNHLTSSLSSPKSTRSPKKSQKISPIKSESLPISSPSPLPLEVVTSPETNNNDLNLNNKCDSSSEKRHHHSQSQASAKKSSSLSTAHNILTKYANRVVKHAVMKRPRKSIITDYLTVRRMKAGSQQTGKRQ